MDEIEKAIRALVKRIFEECKNLEYLGDFEDEIQALVEAIKDVKNE